MKNESGYEVIVAHGYRLYGKKKRRYYVKSFTA